MSELQDIDNTRRESDIFKDAEKDAGCAAVGEATLIECLHDSE